MTPREKAGWLIERFYFSLPNNGSFTGPSNINDRWEEGKMCALIAVDEIIKAHVHSEGVRHLKWWGEVKQEIEIYDKKGEATRND
jgi:hypothetical protein